MFMRMCVLVVGSGFILLGCHGPDPALGPVQVNERIIVVTATYPEANARVVADTVAAPIEQQINGVEGMVRIESESRSDGSYIARLWFEPKAAVKQAAQLVHNRVALATPLLPGQVRQAGVSVMVGLSESEKGLAAIALIDSGNNGPEALHGWSETVRRQLGVAVKLEVFPGPDEQQIAVQIDRVKCAQLGVTAVTVMDAVRPALKAGNIDVLKKLKVTSAK
jgi:multidrug efflux pump subunit AcrB